MNINDINPNVLLLFIILIVGFVTALIFFCIHKYKTKDEDYKTSFVYFYLLNCICIFLFCSVAGVAFDTQFNGYHLLPIGGNKSILIEYIKGFL